MGWIESLLAKPGYAWWGSKFINAAFRRIEQEVDSKAPAVHVHEGMGGDPLVSQAAPLATPGLTLYLDAGQVKLVMDGAVKAAALAPSGHMAAWLEFFG